MALGSSSPSLGSSLHSCLTFYGLSGRGCPGKPPHKQQGWRTLPAARGFLGVTSRVPEPPCALLSPARSGSMGEDGPGRGRPTLWIASNPMKETNVVAAAAD